MSIKICPNCQKEIQSKQNKFCSRSCSASYNNRGKAKSAESNEKRREKLSGRLRKDIENFICKECKNQFQLIRKSYYRPKFCSIECSNISKRKQTREAGRKSSQKRSIRSKGEIRLYELCQKLPHRILHNSIICDGWDADIVFPDLKIAILWNGPWHYREMNMKNHSLKQVQNRDRIKIDLFRSLGWLVLVYEDRDFTPEQAYEDLVPRVGIEPTSAHL